MTAVYRSAVAVTRAPKPVPRPALSGWLLALALGVITPLGAQTPQPLSLSLRDAVARARGSTPVAELARLQVERARARVGVAQASLLPFVSGNLAGFNQTINTRTFGIDFPSLPGQPAFPDLAGPFGLVDLRARLSQTVLDLSAIARISASKTEVTGARADRDATADASAQVAAAVYVEALRADALAAARRSDVEIAAELGSLAEASTEAGVGTAIDVTRARTQEAAARGELVLAENRLRRLMLTLAHAIGVDPGVPLTLTDTLDAALGASGAPMDPDSATALALSLRPDLKAEAARGMVAHGERRAILAERLPRVEAIASYGVSGRGFDELIGTRQVGIQVSLPLLDGLGRERRLENEDLLERESNARTRDLNLQVGTDVRAALLDIASGVQQQGIAAERLRLAQEELALARDRFGSGITGNVEVIEAQSALVHARDAAIDARFTTVIARVNLARATGLIANLH